MSSSNPAPSGSGASAAAAPPGKLSRSEFRRQKDLEEDRKAGRAPAELDEDGNIINPTYPPTWLKLLGTWTPAHAHSSIKRNRWTQTLSKLDLTIGTNVALLLLPGWTMSRGRSSARELRKLRLDESQDEGLFGKATEERCQEARKDVGRGSMLQEVQGLDYAAKRDRWNGYDPSEHKKVVEEFEAIEESDEDSKRSTSTTLPRPTLSMLRSSLRNRQPLKRKRMEVWTSAQTTAMTAMTRSTPTKPMP